ncbi:hypothetical protein Btru_058562 [Bulinus truncatus]|nr:hypothetical protein Btru_058562 [Bulinus truncatus]
MYTSICVSTVVFKFQGSTYIGVSLYKVDNPYTTLWSSTAKLTTYYSQGSIVQCAARCLEQNNTCSAIWFETNNGICTLGKCAITQPVNRSATVDLYQITLSSCNSTPGFNVETNGHTTACLWWSTTRRNFIDAVADCKGQLVLESWTQIFFSYSTRLNDDKQIVKQEVTIKAICGGVISKTARPIWNYDIVVTTAAFCQNMLERDLIRWEDFSLVVLDEVHHCNKLHPYFKLLDKYHNILPAISRPKILGLTASPAGKSSIQETYDMLQGLLKNLGGAKIAIVEEEDEELKSLQSTAEIHPVCVPLSSKEREFRTALLEYIVLCYSKLAHLSNLRTVTTPPCSYLTDAVNHPGDRQISMRIAKRFLVDEEPLSDLIGVINSANPLRETDSQKFGHLKLHLMQIMLSLSEVGTGADFISELDAALSPSKNVEAFQGLGLPFRDMHELVLNFAADGNKDLTMFSKLIETLNDKTFIDWSNRLSKALILVRERKLARQLTKKLRDDPLITGNNLSVQYLVGHGGGAQSHGMDVKKQKRVLDNQEKYNIFVATSIMEEGIDFQLLELVISMNPPTSLRALVQIRGRARKKGSHFVILCSSEEEVEKLNKLQQAEKNMQAAAKHCIEEDRLRSISATRSA